MRIAIGSDHVGFEMKKELMDFIRVLGHVAEDFGPDSSDRAEYPIYAQRVARAVASGKCDLGILICGTGIGMSLAANKEKGIRAAACSEPYSARLTRMHNDANILCIGARVVASDYAKMIIGEFITASFEGERHQKRVDMIAAIERGERVGSE